MTRLARDHLNLRRLLSRVEPELRDRVHAFLGDRINLRDRPGPAPMMPPPSHRLDRGSTGVFARRAAVRAVQRRPRHPSSTELTTLEDLCNASGRGQASAGPSTMGWASVERHRCTMDTRHLTTEGTADDDATAVRGCDEPR